MAGNAAQGARHPAGCGSRFRGGRMIVMLDNYDSFTYSLVQYLGELGAEVRVLRNDEVPVREIEQLSPSHLVISPGPCTPSEAGITLELIGRMAGRVPILGDRKSTRLNSSHLVISYAVFCLKKKKQSKHLTTVTYHTR